ncbi:MAG: HIT family protein [Minisyncoccia bacterium]
MKEELVFETPYWKVILVPQQLYLGRSVVVLKRECGDLADLNKDEIFDFFEVVKKLENLFKETFKATMFNWACLMNNAYQIPFPKPQVHWHFRPRYKDPIEVDSLVFKDPNFGHYYLRGEKDERVVNGDVLISINKKLQEKIE